jgi:hypothetical protein
VLGTALAKFSVFPEPEVEAMILNFEPIETSKCKKYTKIIANLKD